MTTKLGAEAGDNEDCIGARMRLMDKELGEAMQVTEGDRLVIESEAGWMYLL